MNLASEKRQRNLAKEIIGENLVAEKGAFTFPREGGGEEIREVPFAYVPNLMAKCADLVRAHQRYTYTNINHHCTK